MTNHKDLTKKRFGRLLVLSRHNKSKSYYLCRCDCGVEKIIYAGSLRRGATISCGCRMRETIAERIKANTNHGAAAHGGTRTFHSWNHMKARCSNHNHPAWKDYGGRGITVCQRWLDSFENFLADNGECPPGKSIDRYPDKDGNYEPGNTRWATPKEQADNRRPRSHQNRNAKILTFNGESHTLKGWGKKIGVKPATIFARLKTGWPLEKALCFSRYVHI